MGTRVSLHFINPLTKVLSRYGLPLREVAERAQLDLTVLDQQPEYIPLDDLCQLWHGAIELLDDPLLPIKAGQEVHPSDYGLIGALAMNCANIGEALLAMSHYRHLFNGGFHSRAWAAEAACYEFDAPADYCTELTRPIVELDFAASIAMAKFVTHNKYDALMTPDSISFAFAPKAEPQQYAALLGCAVEFEQAKNCVWASIDSLAVPIHAPNDALKESVIAQIEQEKQRLEQQQSLSCRVEALLQEQGPAYPSIEVLATQLLMSKRTLKRRLQEEGQSYSQIVDTLRRRYALTQASESQASISDIAYDLGFSSVSAFHRAFKRWTGQTPKAFMQQLVERDRG